MHPSSRRPLRNVTRSDRFGRSRLQPDFCGASGAGLPEPGYPLHLRLPAGSGADVLVRYFGEKVRPFANRTIIVENKAGRGRQYRGGVHRAREAGRPHRLCPCRQRDRGQHASVQGAADRRREGFADRGRHQQATVHGDGPRE